MTYKPDFCETLDKILFEPLKDSVSCFAAGGCWQKTLQDQKPRDIDVFFKSKEDLDKAVLRFLEKDHKPSYENSSITNYKVEGYTIQFIRRYFYESAEDIFKAFDFSICMASYDGETFETHERFWPDSYAKKLVMPNDVLVKPLSTMKRAFKYVSRGYTICPVGQAKIAKSINALKVDWEDPKDNEIEFYPDGTPTFIGLD